MGGRRRAILAALGGMALCAAALPLFLQEYSAVLFSRLAPGEQLAALAAGRVALPASVRAERIVLRACASVLNSPLGMFQPPETLAALRAQCATLAAEAIARAPLSSWAHLAVAASAADETEFASALLLSQATGAFEGELAQHRFSLAVTRLEHATPAVLAAVSADVGVLVQTAPGRAQLAASYLAFPELRGLVTAAVETAPPASQRAFLAALRAKGG